MEISSEGKILCPPCKGKTSFSDNDELISHLMKEYYRKNRAHYVWINKNIAPETHVEEQFKESIEEYLNSEKIGISNWIRKRFIEMFYGKDPNPFVISMQNPSKYIIMGYVTEHYHFLKNWIKCCSFIMAKTDYPDVQRYEFDNIKEEFFGDEDKPGHIELLLRMGESVGLDRNQVMNSQPLRDTREAINFWHDTAANGHWLDSMVSMHSLELIADRTLRNDGAKLGYFSEGLFQMDLPSEVKEFLKAGYEADQYHSMDALRLVEKYSQALGMENEVKSYFLTSAEFFWDYLNSRVLRGEMYEKEL